MSDDLATKFFRALEAAKTDRERNKVIQDYALYHNLFTDYEGDDIPEDVRVRSRLGLLYLYLEDAIEYGRKTQYKYQGSPGSGEYE